MNITFWDLETTPNKGYTWEKYQQNVIKFVSFSELLSVALKVSGGRMQCKTRADFRDTTDKSLCIWAKTELEKADIIVAHNGDEFDTKKLNARLAVHDLEPLKLFASVDTKKAAKKYCKFVSNSLADLGQQLGLGSKVSTGGFELWEKCMAGDRQAFKKMAKYNKQDVVLLEKVYKRLRPFMANHPSMARFSGMKHGCPICCSEHVGSRGIRANARGLQSQMKCYECGGWFLVPFRNSKEKR